MKGACDRDPKDVDLASVESDARERCPGDVEPGAAASSAMPATAMARKPSFCRIEVGQVENLVDPVALCSRERKRGDEPPGFRDVLVQDRGLEVLPDRKRLSKLAVESAE